MDSYAKYFAANRPKPKWFMGDRVFGRWNKIPFIGTVLNDNIVSEEVGPRVSVLLDLPLTYKGKVNNIIWTTQNSLKKLSQF
jgi:hypothetical protein